MMVIRLFILHLFIIAALVAAPGNAAPPADSQPAPALSEEDVRQIRMFENVFQAALREMHGLGRDRVLFTKRLEIKSKSGLSYSYYDLQFAMDGLVSMYQGTGNTGYLEHAFLLIDNMLAAADRDRDGDGHPEWKAIRSDGKPTKTPDLMLADLQGAQQIARAVRLVMTDPALHKQFGKRARKAYDFLDEHMYRKWCFTRKQKKWFEGRTPWYHKKGTMGLICADLWLAGGKPEHRELAEKIGANFKSHLKYDAGLDCYTWPTSVQGDTSHDNQILQVVVGLAEAGIVFTPEDLSRFANTFVKHIWNGSLDVPQFTNYHDGRNTTCAGRGPFKNGRIYDGWSKLGRFDPKVQQVCVAMLNAIVSGQKSNPSYGFNASQLGRLSLTGNLARNIALRNKPLLVKPAKPGVGK